MFAVPGWSVSPGTLITQAAESLKSQTTATHISPNISNEVKKTGRKKRKHGDGAFEVNFTNLADMWESVIEKKTKCTPAENSKVRRDLETHNKEPSGKSSAEFTTELFVVDEDTQERRFHITKHQKAFINAKREKKVKLAKTENAAVVNLQFQDVQQVPDSTTQLTPLQTSMRQKLISARFRHLNQTLYTTPSSHSLELFQQNPEMFLEYHEGFRRQVEVWPENPVDGYIEQIRRRGKQSIPKRSKSKTSGNSEQSHKEQEILPLPRTDRMCHIADLGCGDAGISMALDKEKKRLKVQISSFDLQNSSILVTKADIAHLPLKDGSVDVAIFCLALMGTNWVDFIEEAFRILRWKGELWVAEIKSRFGRFNSKGNRVDHGVGSQKKSNNRATKKQTEEADDADYLVEVDGQENGKERTDVVAFVEVLRKRGFILQHQNAIDLTNKMFVRMSFVKGQTPIKGNHVPLPKGMVEVGIKTWRKRPKGNFTENDGGDSTLSSESSVLKPCVYKLR